VRFVPWLLALVGAGLWIGHTLMLSAEESQVRRVMAEVFDKPGDLVKVGPLVLDGDHAVAGWVQDGRGGRTVLRKAQGQWSVIVCGGHGLKDADVLAQTGMPLATATVLAKSLAVAESQLDPDTLKKFAMFDGTPVLDVPPDAHQAHAPGVKP
jgi:hypothetical protein